MTTKKTDTGKGGVKKLKLKKQTVKDLNTPKSKDVKGGMNRWSGVMLTCRETECGKCP
jgi:hypothetical protein